MEECWPRRREVTISHSRDLHTEALIAALIWLLMVMSLSLSLCLWVLVSLLFLPLAEPNFYVRRQGPTKKTYKCSCSHRTPQISLSTGLLASVQGSRLLLPPLPLPSHVGPGLRSCPAGTPHSSLTGACTPHPGASSASAVTWPAPVMHKQPPCIFPSCVHRPWSTAGKATGRATQRIYHLLHLHFRCWQSELLTWNSKAMEHPFCLQFFPPTQRALRPKRAF